MSTIQIIYHPLCTVNLWHGFYLHPKDLDHNLLEVDDESQKTDQKRVLESIPKNYSILNDLSFYPSGDSIQLMNNGEMVFREYDHGFSIWIRAKSFSDENNSTKEEKYKPFIPLDTGLKLIIPFSLRNPTFVNFTNIGMDKPRHYIYYFSNKAENATIFNGGSKSLFLNSNSPPHQYISEEDRFPIYSNIKQINLATFEVKSIKFLIASKGELSRQIVVTFKTEKGQDYLKTCKILLKGFPSGLYEQTAYSLDTGREEEITNLKEIFYHNNGAVSGHTFGIIEIFPLSNENSEDYQLMDDEGRLNSPVYTLWWQNRMTKWRYIFNKDQPKPSMADTGSDVEFENGDKKKLITKKFQPLLSKRREIKYNVDEEDKTEKFILPNPDAARLYPDNTKDTIYSEVHMGNIDFQKLENLSL